MDTDSDFQNDGKDIPKDNHESINVNNEESDSFHEIPKEKFSFYVSAEVWNNEITIKEDKRGDRYLGGNWSRIFLGKLQEINETCSLVIKSNKVKRGKTRTTKAPFFRGKAVCMFPGCVKYEMLIKKSPAEDKKVKVKVRTIRPNTKIRHEADVTKSRPIKGKERLQIRDELQFEKPSQVFYKRLGNISNRQYDAGNLSGVGTKPVLQKISSEGTLSSRLHKDVITELSLQKEIYDSLDDDEHPKNAVKGCIQHLSIYPFSTHVYTAKQLQILSDVIKEGNCTLYFDATGKVVSKIPDQNKRVFYYPLLLKGREKGDPPIPVAEMLANSHNTTDICNFFLKFFRDLKIFKPTCGLPSRIEIDFSWAFIHGILLALNKENVDTYLQRAWSVLQHDGEWGNNVVLHICSAHLLHNISHHVAEHLNDKSARAYVKYVFGLMIDTRNSKDLETLYRNLAILLLSPTEDAHPEYNSAKGVLDSSILSREVSDSIDETETPECVDSESSLSGKTMFFEHFEQIRRSVEEAIETTSSGPENFLHSPKLLTYVTKTYMSIAPLWTGSMLDDITHDTNSPAENWMKIVKKDILNDKQRLRPALFVRRLRGNINGRLKEYDRKLTVSATGKKRRVRKRKTDFNEAQESLGGKKKKKKGIYLKSPKEVPKKKEKKTRYSERALHWGGTLTLPNGSTKISNTCTVDNMLVFFNMLLDIEHINTWITEHSELINVCRILLEIKSLFQSGNWNEGRALWLTEFCSPPVGEPSWNIYGSESERFVIHLQFQESVVRSECSKRKCPRKRRILHSTEILLGDINDSTPGCITLQDSLSQWEVATELPCSGDRCRGTQSFSQRQFTYGTPPVLVLSVSYLSQLRGFTVENIPEDVQVTGLKYTVFGYTMNTGDHFVGYFRRGSFWCRYDGLKNPEIIEAHNQGTGKLEHILLVNDVPKPK